MSPVRWTMNVASSAGVFEAESGSVASGFPVDIDTIDIGTAMGEESVEAESKVLCNTPQKLGARLRSIWSLKEEAKHVPKTANIHGRVQSKTGDRSDSRTAHAGGPCGGAPGPSQPDHAMEKAIDRDAAGGLRQAA